MTSFRILDRKGRQIVAAVALSVATVVPTLVPALASAAQLSGRSVALSSSSKTATGVSYAFTFSADAGGAGGVVVEFCSNTPLMLESCTAPTGFTAATATVSGATRFTSASPADNKVQLTKSISTGSNTFTLANVTNPSSAGTIYARIVTYDTDAHTDNYTTTAFGTGKADDGSVAISITDSVGVSGAVLESMTFCVAKVDITKGCANAAANAPTLELGETVGSVKALDVSHISTGSIYTQLSTNAASGAVISLKTNNSCGGLMRVGASVCDIVPASGTFSAGEAKFGLKTAASSNDPSDASGNDSNGTLQANVASGYNSSTYLLNYASNNSTGVTSTYGDPLLDTDGGPVSNKNMQITFGASIANNTPAGKYSADLSLVATGTF